MKSIKVGQGDIKLHRVVYNEITLKNVLYIPTWPSSHKSSSKEKDADRSVRQMTASAKSTCKINTRRVEWQLAEARQVHDHAGNLKRSTKALTVGEEFFASNSHDQSSQVASSQLESHRNLNDCITTGKRWETGRAPAEGDKRRERVLERKQADRLDRPDRSRSRTRWTSLIWQQDWEWTTQSMARWTNRQWTMADAVKLIGVDGQKRQVFSVDFKKVFGNRNAIECTPRWMLGLTEYSHGCFAELFARSSSLTRSLNLWSYNLHLTPTR